MKEIAISKERMRYLTDPVEPKKESFTWLTDVCEKQLANIEKDKEERNNQILMQKSKNHLEKMLMSLDMSEEMKNTTIQNINELSEALNQ